MTDEQLREIEERAVLPDEGKVFAYDIRRMLGDVPALVAEVRRLQAELDKAVADEREACALRADHYGAEDIVVSAIKHVWPLDPKQQEEHKP